MAFFRVVEVLPPSFALSASRKDTFSIEASVVRFADEIRRIRDLADVFLVANVKDVLSLDQVHTANLLHKTLGVDAAPVVVIRDLSRPRFLSSVLTGISTELNWMMVAWGDDHGSAKANMREFPTLAAAIREASQLRSQTSSPIRFMAPVGIDALARPRGVALANGRIRAGADLLLAQPPTTDADDSFDRHVSLLEKAGLEEKATLNVFPFKDEADVKRYERMFGWRLPKSLHESAAEGEASLLRGARGVVRRLRKEGYPGVYITTRGNLAVAKTLLS